jgi:hypothetical protein
VRGNILGKERTEIAIAKRPSLLPEPEVPDLSSSLGSRGGFSVG